MKHGKRAKTEKPSRKSPGVMNIILIVVGICLLIFTIAMIQLFKQYGAVPDTLVTCVFASLGGECGIMGWIKTTKDRRREREWEVEDKQEAKAEAKENEAAQQAAEPPQDYL